MNVGLIIGIVIVLGMVGIVFVLALTPQPTSNSSVVFPADQVEAKINEKIDLGDPEYYRDPQFQSPYEISEPLDVEFEALCNTSFYNPFDEKKVDFENTMEFGYCFPLSYLEISSCGGPNDFPEITICDADIVYPEPNQDDSMGIITDANGVAFVNMECLMTENWGWCKDNIIIDPFGNMLSFFDF